MLCKRQGMEHLQRPHERVEHTALLLAPKIAPWLDEQNWNVFSKNALLNKEDSMVEQNTMTSIT